MAALSMALGMADEIQENSAAIHLDMMFIDEGFGSLDEHAREQAVRVLKEMAGGSKLIGIISHVTELKQEMEDQLLITKDVLSFRFAAILRKHYRAHRNRSRLYTGEYHYKACHPYDFLIPDQKGLSKCMQDLPYIHLK